MARRRFFATSVADGRAWIEGAGAHHLTRVLRAEAGQHYELAHAGQVYLACVVRAAEQRVEFSIVETLPLAAVAELEAGVAVFKFDRFEWMLEKATEVGLTRLWPLLTRRTEPKLAAAASRRVQRWQTIVRQAAEQARRTTMPAILPPLAFNAFLALPAPAARWLLDETPGGITLPAATPCRLLAGPEGGWAPEETAAAQAAGFTRVALGPRILRCETAVLAALVLAGR
ncbi:MAG: RsmE family RNA methyltransferase [Terriglobales bacterium]